MANRKNRLPRYSSQPCAYSGSDRNMVTGIQYTTAPTDAEMRYGFGLNGLVMVIRFGGWYISIIADKIIPRSLPFKLSPGGKIFHNLRSRI